MIIFCIRLFYIPFIKNKVLSINTDGYTSFPFFFAQVADRAKHIGSALLNKGHSHTGDKFIGIFSLNRPEVQNKPTHKFNTSSCLTRSLFPLSGPFQSWPVTHTLWWRFPCTTLWVGRPSATSSTKVPRGWPLRG